MKRRKNTDAEWEKLYNEAKKVLAPRKISEWMEAGGVAAAIGSRPAKYTPEYALTVRVRSAR